MTAVLCAPVRATRLERALLALSRVLSDVAVERMRLRAATAERHALRVAAAERGRDAAAAVHLGILPR
jgi:hypothetical protein